LSVVMSNREPLGRQEQLLLWDKTKEEGIAD
jgi:hypothetical protein